jgi:hypothetical protein
MWGLLLLVVVLLLSSSSSSSSVRVFITLFSVFTITYLEQTVFLGYLMSQLFCSYNLCYM